MHHADAKSKAKTPKVKSPQMPESDKEKDKALFKDRNAPAERSEGGPAGSLAMFSHLPPHLRMTAQVAVKKSDVRTHLLDTECGCN